MLRILAILAVVIATPLVAETRVPQSPAEISLGFAPLVKQAAPAVVNIYAKRIVQVQSSPFANDPFFQDFFRGQGQTRPQVQNSLGSGVILAADGLMVTNYHVVGEATDIRAVLKDRREFDARVLLADEESDLAILQLEGARNMPHLTLRDSDTIEVGELVLAIGNPFGVGQTVTSGIISGLARSGTASGGARGYFIQTDAPINPGNSGGALVDINGDLIGINTRILTRSGGSNGIGFAIPSALVQQFLDQAHAGNDRFLRPWAGMNGQPVDPDIANSLGLPSPHGLVISELHAESPFADAGFQPRDVIVAVGGKDVNTPDEMVFRMIVAGLGNTVAVTRIREGRREDIDVALMAAPDTPSRAEKTTGRRSAIPGMTLWSLNPAVLSELGLPLSVTGVAVADPGPAGARAGLRRGDVLRSINGDEVGDSESADTALSKASGRLTLEVQRGIQRIVMRFRL